jgi:trimeric autotransporter adhesin
LANGGTGATTAAAARTNLQLSSTDSVTFNGLTVSTAPTFTSVNGNTLVKTNATGVLSNATSTDVTSLLGFTPASNTLPANQIFVGSAGGIATAVSMSGDASIVSSGTITLKNTGTAGTYGSASAVPTITTDAQGRVTNVTTNAYQDATTVTKGILQVGTNLQVAAGVISLQNADSTHTGALTSADWSTFNSKQNALGFTPLNVANNLSDVANVATARTNLGLGTAASPTFTGMTLSSMSTAGFVKNSAAGVLSGGNSIVLSTDVTGTLAIANGGTGAATANAALNNLLPTQTGNNGKVLSTNGTNTSWISAAVGTVTNVTGTAPISVATGTSTPVISMTQANGTTDGYISSSDFTTFNNKLNTSFSNVTGTLGLANGGTGATTAAAARTNLQLSSADSVTFNGLTVSGVNGNTLVKTNGTGVLSNATSADVTSLLGFTPGTVKSVTAAATANNPITIGGTATAPTVDIAKATASVNGYLSSADFTAFAAKQAGSAELTGLSGLATTGFVKRTGAGAYSTSSSIALSTDVSGILPVANGGTGATTLAANQLLLGNGAGAVTSAGAMTNGQLLIGSTGVAPVVANITGTANQITVTNGAGSITLSTPQNIHSGASPTFTGMTLSGVNGNTLVKTNGSGVLSNATSTDVTSLLGFTPASATLATNKIFVGNGSNIATAVSMSGDASIVSDGTITLKNTGTAGTYGSASAVPTITTDAQGRVTNVTTNAYQDATGATKGIVQVGNNISVTGGVISVATANGSTTGVITSSDWTTFNSKQNALGFTPLNVANNLSDVANVATARTNLGLGTGSSPSFTGMTLSGVNGNTLVKTNATGVVSNATSADVTSLLGLIPGTVTSITAGTGLTGGTITTSGTIGLGTELSGLNGLATTGFMKRNASGSYSTVASIDLTNSVSGTLPVANGGTGITATGANGNVMYVTGGAFATATPDAAGLVDKSSTQTIAGVKTHSGNLVMGSPSALFQLQDSTTNTISMKAPSAVTSYTMTWPAAVGNAGQVLTTSATGVLSWANAAAGTVTNVSAAATAGNPMIVLTNTTTPTIDIPKATVSVNGYLSSADYTTFAAKQNGSTELTAIAALGAGPGFIRKTAANTYSMTSSIDLTNSVTGALPLANGGTGATTASAARTNLQLSSADSVTFNGLTVSGVNGNTLVKTNATGVLSNATSTDVTSLLGFTPASNTLATNKIFVGSAGGIATAVSMSGDASIVSSGTITLKNTGTAGTYGSASAVPTITTDAQGRVTNVTTNAYQDATGATKGIVSVGNNLQVSGGVISVATANGSTTGVITSSDWSTFNSKQNALGFTPLNVANNLSDVANVATARTNLGLGTAASPTFTGMTLSGVNGNTLVKTNATGVVSNATSADVTSLLGYVPGTGTVTNVTGTAPITVATGTSTPVISMSRSTASVDGYLASSDFTKFNNKLSNFSTMTSADVSAAKGFVNGGNSFAGAATIGTNDNNTLSFKTNNTTRMTIDTAGNIGVGTATPTTSLDIIGSGFKVRNLAGTAGLYYNVFGGGVDEAITGNWAPHTTGDVIWYSGVPGSGTERMRLKSGGNLGLGVSAPAYKLDVAGDINLSAGSNFKVNGVNVGTGTVTSVTAAATANNPITIGGTAAAPTVDIAKATASVNGYLSSADFTTFAAKQSGSAELTGLSGLATTGFVKRTGAGAYSTSSSIALSTDVSGILPVANGGTGAATVGSSNGISLTTGAGTFSIGTNATTTTANNTLVMRDGTGVMTANGVGFTNTGTVTVSAAAASATYGLVLPGSQGAANTLLKNDGAGNLSWATAGTVTNVTGTAPISVGTGTSTPVISMARSTASVDGYLASSDFTIFNNKLSNFSTMTSADVSAAKGFVNGGNSFAGSATIGTNDNNTLSFKTNNANRMTIDTAGNVGIGTITPTSPLSVVQNTNSSSSPGILVQNTSNGSLAASSLDVTNDVGAKASFFVSSSTNSGASLANTAAFSGSNGVTVFTNSGVTTGGTDPFTVRVGGYLGLNEKFRITSSGNVGIGTTAPAYKLDVAGDINLSTGSNFKINGVNVGTGTVTSVTAAATVNNPITIGGTAVAPTIDIPMATNAVNGYLSSTDRTAFAAKQAGSTELTALAALGTGPGFIRKTAANTYSMIASIDVTSQITGTLPVSNGGTGATTAANNTFFMGPSTGGPLAPSFRTIASSDINAIAFVNGGNSFGATANIGTNDANQLNIKTNGSTRMSFDASGAVQVNGQAYSNANVASCNAGSATCNWDANTSNVIVYNAAAQATPAVTITNMKPGGSYMLVVLGSGTGATTITCNGATPSFVPANGSRINGTKNKSVYTLMWDGTDCLVTWITGF